MEKKNKKPIIFMLLLVAVSIIVGGTIAYYTSSDTFENEFDTGTYKIETQEAFVSPENWTPGTTTPKTVIATNKGTTPAAVRIKLTPSWKDANGGVLSLTDSHDNEAAIINFANNLNSRWTYSNGYYYYNYYLDENESTSSLLNSVTFNPNVDITGTHNCESVNGVETCVTEMNGYAGGTYELKIEVETCQYDKYQEIWGTSLTIGPTPTATEMIGEISTLVEVAGAKRYNGANPDNYVTFDGDSWRIIGVYGDNLKIVKADKLVDNKKYCNEIIHNYRNWVDCELREYLNGDYYNSLSSTAKDMIDTHEWYVNSGDYYYNAQSAYNDIKTETWNGKIGLMAPYELLYSANQSCWGTSADGMTADCVSSMWLKSDNASWFINSYSSASDTALCSNINPVHYTAINQELAVNPVVYLKSSVKISGGSGTEDSPYILK